MTLLLKITSFDQFGAILAPVGQTQQNKWIFKHSHKTNLRADFQRESLAKGANFTYEIILNKT